MSKGDVPMRLKRSIMTTFLSILLTVCILFSTCAFSFAASAAAESSSDAEGSDVSYQNNESVSADSSSAKEKLTHSIEPKEELAPSGAQNSSKVSDQSSSKTVQAATQAPTQKPAETLTLSAKTAKTYVGCYYQLIAKSNAAVKFSSSNTAVATVTADGFVYAKKAGTVNITAKTSAKSAVCKVTVSKGSAVNISHKTATVNEGKTFFAASTTSKVTWKTSDNSVATVKDGFILALKTGKAVITVSTSSGAATCLVTVVAAAPFRMSYTTPNCALKNSTVTFVAITDKKRTDVKFEFTVGSSKKTVKASSKKAEGNTYVWKGSYKFTAAGTYTIKAYSLCNNKWSTSPNGQTTAFVASSSDTKTTVCANRRASDNCLKFIAGCEGFLSSVYYDSFTGDPTIGYGRLVYKGQQFYNGMTQTEAYALLAYTVNNNGFSADVNSFLVKNNIKFNQQQFDALVAFVYGTGTGVLVDDDEIRDALLKCSDGSAKKTTYYINDSYVNFRKGAGTNYGVIRMLDKGTVVTLIKKTSAKWYNVKLADGTKGYVCADYVSSRTTGGNLDLNYINKQYFINKFCQYHHAGGKCVRGLLDRHIDEMEMFFYGDYIDNYGANSHKFTFKCAVNPSFHT